MVLHGRTSPLSIQAYTFIGCVGGVIRVRIYISLSVSFRPPVSVGSSTSSTSLRSTDSSASCIGPGIYPILYMRHRWRRCIYNDSISVARDMSNFLKKKKKLNRHRYYFKLTNWALQMNRRDISKCVRAVVESWNPSRSCRILSNKKKEKKGGHSSQRE